MSNLKAGIAVNGLHSFRDFGLTISSKTVGLPKKKLLRETIPFANGSYDFSMISGEIIFEDRTAKYTFDIIDNDVVSMQVLRSKVATWLLMVHEANIYDDDYPGWHVIGSYSNDSWSEDNESGELTVTFKCYSFLVADEMKEYSMATGTHQILNDGSRNAVPTIDAPFGATITIGDRTITFTAGTYNDSSVFLTSGTNTWGVQSSGVVTVKFREEII